MISVLSAELFSQDQLFKKDNSKEEVKILEVTPDEIKYKLKVNPNGPLYTIYKKDVALIIYENGMHETYPDAKPQTIYIQPAYLSIDSIRAKKKHDLEQSYSRLTRSKNVVLINAIALVASNLNVSYLREFAAGQFALHIPLAVSFMESSVQNWVGGTGPAYYSDVNNYKLTQKAIDAGLGIYLNTSGRRPATHFIGPLFRMVQYNGTFQTTYTDNMTGQVDSYTHGFVLNENYAMVNTGFLFRVTDNFNMMISAAAGVVTASYYTANNPANFQKGNYNVYPRTSNTTFQLSYNFGYRF